MAFVKYDIETIKKIYAIITAPKHKRTKLAERTARPRHL